jgi:hypothetical protein
MPNYDDMLQAEAAKPGLFAHDPADGALFWSADADIVCDIRKDSGTGISAAFTAISGAVFTGHKPRNILLAYLTERK